MDNSYRNVIPSTGNMTYTILGNTGSVIPSDHKIAQKNSFVLGLVWLRTCGIVLARTLPRKQLLTGLSVVPSPFFPFLSIFSSGFIAGPRLHFLSILCSASVFHFKYWENRDTRKTHQYVFGMCASKRWRIIENLCSRFYRKTPLFVWNLWWQDGDAMVWLKSKKRNF